MKKARKTKLAKINNEQACNRRQQLRHPCRRLATSTKHNVVLYSGPLASLRENMTSSTKPEVHNILLCRQRRTEPRPQRKYGEIFDKWFLWYLFILFCLFNNESKRALRPLTSPANTRIDRQTYRDTDTLTVIIHPPTGAK